MFACCLEDARYEAAEEAFAALVHTFFDWNEVRVTSLSELSEVMARLPDPRVAGNRIKRILHGIFEATYSFDLEDKRKKNLGPTVKWLEKLDGATQVHRRLRGPVGLGRPPNPHRRRHHGRLAHPRPGHRQGRGRRRRAGAGAGGGQVQGDRVRLAAAPTGRGAIRPIRISPAVPRFPAANRSAPPRIDSRSAGLAREAQHAEPAGKPAKTPPAGKTAAAKPAPEPETPPPAAARRPAAKGRAHSPRRPAEAAPPAEPAAEHRQGVARRRDSPRPNGRETVLVGGTLQTQTTLRSGGKRSAVRIHALSLAPVETLRRVFAGAAGRRPSACWHGGRPGRRHGRPVRRSRRTVAAAGHCPIFPDGLLEGPPEPFVPKPLGEADRDRQEAAALCAAGRAHYQRGEYEQALRMYQRALRCESAAAMTLPSRSSSSPMTWAR